jgi:hypothetical protein
MKRTALTASLRVRDCETCGKPFQQARSMQAVCSPRCAVKLPAVKARREKAADKQARERLMTLSDWRRKAQTAVNKVARLRDIRAGRGCISCGEPYRGAYGGAFDAGHFRSVGSAPHVRYFLPAIRLQCVKCNRFLGGNAVEFRRGLVALRGVEFVEMVESMQFTAKHTITYLSRLTDVMNRKARRLQKRIEAM